MVDLDAWETLYSPSFQIAAESPVAVLYQTVARAFSALNNSRMFAQPVINSCSCCGIAAAGQTDALGVVVVEILGYHNEISY